MIKYYILRSGTDSDAVVFLRGEIAETAAQITHYDIMRCDYESEVAKTNAFAGRRLAGDRDLGILNDQFSGERD